MTRLHRQSIFLVLITLLCLPSYAIAVGLLTVLTFDDVDASSFNIPVPSGYGGLSWPIQRGHLGRIQRSLYLTVSAQSCSFQFQR